MKKIISQMIILIILIIALSISVNAFAISMPYMPDRTLVLYPGESSDFTLGLQNMVGEQDELTKVIIISGNEIARITDKENVYKIPKGTKDTAVHVKIDIPSNASLGTEWDVQFNAVLVTEKEGGGMVQIATGLSDGFKVRVGPVPEKLPLTKEKSAVNTLWLIGGTILIMLIALALVYYIRRKKR